MSTIEAPNMTQEQDIIDAQKSSQRKKRMSIAIGIFLLIGLLWALYWFFIARYHEETENAYVAGSMVVVNAQTVGTVEAILAEENQVVKAGDVLVKLNPTDAQVALAQAQAQLANATRQIQNVFNTVSVTRAQMVQANSAVKTAQDAVNRRAVLVKTGAVSREEYDQAVNALNQALAAQKTTMEQNKSAGAQVAGTTTQNHPAIEAAKAAFRSAYINSKRLAVLAPTDGVIAKRNVQVGQQISQGVPLMSIVAANQLWVEANFKETQLANLRVGQPVELTSDVFGSGVKFKGTVQGIGIGTGSAFSVLPAQNATGNWIKIVQRIPVRIQLNAEELKAHPLRVGMSMIANVNTHQRNGAVLGTVAGSDGLSNLTTNVYAQDEEEANREADKIINANLH
ncbi:MAG: emrA [Burkholderiaceae bacterium]|nr:emrA [Burkholderiaceae bacterium]